MDTSRCGRRWPRCGCAPHCPPWGAGLAAYADHVTRHGDASSAAAGAAVIVPAAVFLVTVRAVMLRTHQRRTAEWVP
ncbi:hypothetical protein ABT063_08340 [Streptomyces sp. NPDC002838]|uniref:hypothetical protein n=1 Tax=Streptomyces sp. NPDC002838 TaxID=3154436 RepID=UPI00332C4EAF